MIFSKISVNLKSINFVHTLIVVLMIAFSLMGCVNVTTTPGGHTSYSTLGVASILVGQNCSQIQLSNNSYKVQKDNRTENNLEVNCENVVRVESKGFTGWDVLDAALTGFLSWITFGALAL